MHAIVDNYATHKHPKVREWLIRHRRWTFTSRRPRRPGSTPSRASSPRSPGAPRIFPALVRFSNGESFRKPDKRPQPRGIAIKLVGVAGPKLLEDEKEAVTQDFLATSHSVTSTVRHVAVHHLHRVGH